MLLVFGFPITFFAITQVKQMYLVSTTFWIFVRRKLNLKIIIILVKLFLTGTEPYFLQ